MKTSEVVPSTYSYAQLDVITHHSANLLDNIERVS